MIHRRWLRRRQPGLSPRPGIRRIGIASSGSMFRRIPVPGGPTSAGRRRPIRGRAHPRVRGAAGRLSRGCSTRWAQPRARGSDDPIPSGGSGIGPSSRPGGVPPRAPGRGSWRIGRPPLVARPRARGSPPSRPDGPTSSSVYPRARGLDAMPLCAPGATHRPIPVPGGRIGRSWLTRRSASVYPRVRGLDAAALRPAGATEADPGPSPRPGVRLSRPAGPPGVRWLIPAPGDSTRGWLPRSPPIRGLSPCPGAQRSPPRAPRLRVAAYPRARGLGDQAHQRFGRLVRPIPAPRGLAMVAPGGTTPCSAYPRARGLDTDFPDCGFYTGGLSPCPGSDGQGMKTRRSTSGPSPHPGARRGCLC